MPRLRIVSIVLATLLVIGGGFPSWPQEVAANQTGPGVNDRTNNMIGLCRMNFGIEDVTPHRTPGSGLYGTTFLCIGGPLDGLKCLISKNATICDWSKVGMESTTPSHVEIDVPTLTFATELSDITADPGITITPDTGTGPMLVEAVITWNPSAEAATQAILTQVNGCRHLGGNDQVGGPDTAATPHTVGCEGGMLDGMWCAFGVGMSTCFFQPATSPAAPTTEPPIAEPTEPAMATEAPTESTEVPTESPLPTATAAPTDEPVIEPTFVDPGEDNPWDVPEGTLAPLEPAPEPTEAPLR